MKSIISFVLCVIFFSSLSAQVETDMVNMKDKNQNFLGVQGFNINSFIHFKDSWKDANGFYVTYGSISSNHWSLILQTGYFSFKSNEDAGFSGNEYFEMIPIQIGTRYYMAMGRFRPFLLAMSGFNFIEAK